MASSAYAFIDQMQSKEVAHRLLIDLVDLVNSFGGVQEEVGRGTRAGERRMNGGGARNH